MPESFAKEGGSDSNQNPPKYQARPTESRIPISNQPSAFAGGAVIEYSLAMPSCLKNSSSPLLCRKLIVRSSFASAVAALTIFAAIALSSPPAVWGEELPESQTDADNSAGQAPQNQTPPDKTTPGQPAGTPLSNKIPGAKIYNLLQKKSIVFPDIAASQERLSAGQKFQLFVDNSGSVHTVSWSILGAALGQADNSPTGFGQGWDAYAKRFGASMARGASNEFFGTFVISSVLHLDPRFYPEANPTLFHAAKYSVQRVFIMRNDEGRDVIAWPRLVGPLMGESLANVYWPDRNRTVGDTLFRYGVDLATRAGGNMLREYWPVLHRKLGHSTHITPRD
jgi:hypothetical protein